MIGINPRRIAWNVRTEEPRMPRRFRSGWHLVPATGRHIGKDFDDARSSTFFISLPISWRGTLVQYKGRLHRRHPRKMEEVRIVE